jgi:hypothetical protein
MAGWNCIVVALVVCMHSITMIRNWEANGLDGLEISLR